MFDIPMNTTGTFSTDQLMSLNGGNQSNVGGMQQAQPMQQTPQMQQNYQAQPQMQQSYQPMQQAPQMAQPVQQQNSGVIVKKQRPQGNGVILKKGQKVNLAQNGEVLNSIQVCLGWDIKNVACDLDASAFMLGADGRVLGDDWFVFYGQPTSPDNSISHSGDSQGESVGDDEVISINLQTINPNCKKVVFVVTINEALEQGLNFSMVENAYVRVINTVTGQELIKFTLSDYYANVTSMVVGEVYNHNGQWKFNAVGDGVAKDLAGLCGMYGVNVAG